MAAASQANADLDDSEFEGVVLEFIDKAEAASRFDVSVRPGLNRNEVLANLNREIGDSWPIAYSGRSTQTARESWRPITCTCSPISMRVSSSNGSRSTIRTLAPGINPNSAR